ncbi:MAG: lipoyl(octanoyl) transferase LipB [Candidatus Binataceae bacterium]
MEQSRKLQVARMGAVDYAAALKLQDELVAARHQEMIGDTLLLLEHPHVFTFGRGADERFLLRKIPGVPVFRVSRGGQITYHGPGQLVGYPILKLEGRNRDIGLYLRNLEQVLIDAIGRISVEASRREGLTGVWVGARKIASIGVGVRRWVTFHGFALNVTADLTYFSAITPCGIAGCEMTSLADAGCGDLSVEMAATLVGQSFCKVFDYQQLETIAPAALWRRIDRPSTACNAIT